MDQYMDHKNPISRLACHKKRWRSWSCTYGTSPWKFWYSDLGGGHAALIDYRGAKPLW